MADLDSFFAKKDRKKTKGKKFTTTEEIAKRLEVTEKKSDRVVLNNTKTEIVHKPIDTVDPTTVTESTTGADQQIEDSTAVTEPVIKEVKVEEEQWNDFKDEETLDVSNLKITKLNIEEEEEGWGGGGDGNDEGKENSGEDKKDGVWKIEEQKSIQSTICEAVDAGISDGLKATVAAMSANARWNSKLAGELQPSLLPRGGGVPGGRRKVAPDINSDMAFPTLADAKAAGGRKKTRDDDGGGMRSHGGGGLSSRSSGGGGLRSLSTRDGGAGAAGAYKPPMLRTNNRFGALTDHGSLMRNS